MGAFGPKNYDTLLAESCEHLKIVGKEALLPGNLEARKYIEIVSPGQVFFYREFWAEADAKSTVWPLSNTDRLRQRRQRIGEQAQATIQQLGRLQAEARNIDDLLYQQSIQPMADEIIARRAQWETEQAEAQRAAQAERFAEDLRKQQEAEQRQRDYQAAVAQQHQERAQREAENAERRRRELAPFMP